MQSEPSRQAGEPAAAGQAAPYDLDPRLVAAYESASRALAWLTVAVGCAALVGWATDVEILKAVFPGYPTVKADTAIALILAGLALRTTARGSALRWRAIGIALACAAGLIGALSLAEYVFGIDLGIDQILVADRATTLAGGAPGRMAPATALSLLLAGAAIVAVHVQEKGYPIGAVLASVWLALAWLRLVAYVFGGRIFVGAPLWATMALPTAFGFACLGAGVAAARPERGGMRLFAARGAGGASARRLVPLMILLPLLLGEAVRVGEVLQYYDGSYRLSLSVALMTIAMVALVIARGYAEERADTARRRAELRLARSESRWRTIADAATDIVARSRPDGTLIYISQAVLALVGHAPDELLGRKSADFIVDEDRDLVRDGYAAALEFGTVQTLRYRVRRRDGRIAWLESRFQAVPSLESPGEREIASVTRDVTAQVEGERTRADFIAMLSHDLKNPLGILSAYLDVIDEAPDDPTRRETTARMRPVVEIAERIARNMLDVIRIESDALPLSRRLASLDEIVARAVERERGAARLKRVAIDVHLGGLGPMRLDPDLIERAVDNLLGNALEFAPPGTGIDVETSAGRGAVRLSVRDRGPGIAREDWPMLFERFQSGRGSTGLGLFIVRCIAEAHGGLARFDPPSDGGSRFVVELPIAA